MVIHLHLILQRKIVNKVFRSALTGAASFALVLGVFSAPASAATITDATATSSAAIGTSGTNATPITVTAKLITVGTAETFMVALPENWKFSSGTNGSCSGRATYTMSDTLTCQSASWGLALTSAVDFSTAVSISVTFPANTLEVRSGRFFQVSFRNHTPTPEAVIDIGNATLSVVEPTPAGDGTTPAGGGTTTGGTTPAATTPLTAQTAPATVPATIKPKKKLKITAKSSAGLPVTVTVAGGCKVKPVVKTTKTKVGKKTVKTKTTTAYTVTMGKKKGATCTITQANAGDATYAPLNSVSTVTLK